MFSNFTKTPSRRSMIRSLASASMLLPGMLHEMMAEPSADSQNPLAPKAPMFPAKAKQSIACVQPQASPVPMQ